MINHRPLSLSSRNALRCSVLALGLLAACDTTAPTEAAGPAVTTASIAAPSAGATLTKLRISPKTTYLTVKTALQFSVSGTWSDGTLWPPAVTWQATGGTVTSAGKYTAGSTMGTYLVIATQAGGTLADTALVTLKPRLLSMTIAPAAVSLAPGATQQMIMSGTYSDSSSTPPLVNYSATGGTISKSGLYTAGSTPGNYRVIAVHQGGAMADTAAITITSPVAIVALAVAPGATSLPTGSSKQLVVSATLSDGSTLPNPAVSWAASGGTISNSGMFTAGSSAGAYSVTATSGNGKLGAATVTVTTSGGGTGVPGNLFSMGFESGNYGVLSNGGGGAPNSYSIPSSGGYNGGRYAEAYLGGGSSDQAANMYWNGDTPRNNLWVVVAIKVTTTPSSGLMTQKMVIFRQSGYNTQLGEMNQIDGNYIWNWLDGGHSTVIAAAGTINSTLGQWNVWKFHLDSRGATPVLTVGLNGRDNIFTTTKPGAKAADPAIVNFGGTLNGGSGASRFGFDYIQIGTNDPGWP